MSTQPITNGHSGNNNYHMTSDEPMGSPMNRKARKSPSELQEISLSWYKSEQRNKQICLVVGFIILIAILIFSYFYPYNLFVR